MEVVEHGVTFGRLIKGSCGEIRSLVRFGAAKSHRERERDTKSVMALPEKRNRFFIPYANLVFLFFLFFFISLLDNAVCIRISNQIPDAVVDSPDRPLKSAVFALGSFWRSEAAFGCISGVVRTTSGYAGGNKANPEYRNLGDHAESVQVEYDPRIIGYRQLLDLFWSSHDSRQVFGQGPDVGKQYRSCIFTNSTEEMRLATTSKEREQLKSRNSVVTTQIQQLGTFYRAEPDHQKFELKQHPLLLQLIGNIPEEELERSALATKLNGYAAELCPPRIQKKIDSRVNEIIRKGWPVLRDI
uniref:Peptide methionine sulfoxide reductase A5 n=1 Tax=Noccaea caerulescens TaxID=107243 RepID=A0A1J3C7U9_NOCCA